MVRDDWRRVAFGVAVVNIALFGGVMVVVLEAPESDEEENVSIRQLLFKRGELEAWGIGLRGRWRDDDEREPQPSVIKDHDDGTRAVNHGCAKDRSMPC